MTSVSPVVETAVPVPYLVDEDLCRRKFYSRDFTGAKLYKKRMRQSLFYRCIFDDADMTEADCEGSEFTGSTFRRTNCYRTNFKDAKLGATLFEPKDCFGMTVTLQCKTFEQMKVSPLWWNIWLMLATMMHPVQPLAPGPLMEEKLIAFIGAEKYVKLRSMLKGREL